VNTPRGHLWVVLGAALVGAACSSGSSGGTDAAGADTSSDAAADSPTPLDANAPDGAAADVPPAPDAADAVTTDAMTCSPAVPTPTILAAGGTERPTGVHDVILTSSGELAVFFQQQAGGEGAFTWNGAAWTSHMVVPPSNGGVGSDAVGEVAGRPVRFATTSDPTNPTQAPRFWLQLSDGSFAAGQTITGFPMGSVWLTRWSAGASLLSAAGLDASHRVVSYLERNASGSWTVGQVSAITTTIGVMYPAGVGTLADHTAFAAVNGTPGLQLFRRAGISWSLLRTFVPVSGSSVVRWAYTAAPPEGSSAQAVALYTDPTTGALTGLHWSLTDGSPTGSSTLLPTVIQDPLVDIVYRPDGASGYLLVFDSNARTAWIIGFEGTAFAAPQALRPDLTYDARPRLLYHPCGGFMVLHVARAPSDAPNSAPLVLEDLHAFAPGIH
jgi:hypothetical protein